MIAIRKANDRGHANYGWLNTWHTLEFAATRPGQTLLFDLN